MKAMIVEPSRELALAEVPEPAPGPGQALVEVEAIGVGYVDVMARRGDDAHFPGVGSVLGLEVVGRVRAASGVAEELVGKRVLALPDSGGYAERVAADADRLLPAPEGADPVEVVALGLNALVAEGALHRTGLAAGERVLVRGASGGIGVLATQIAHARGAEITAVTSSPEKAERLRTLGAAKVIDRTRADRPEDTYDVVVDTVAGPQVGEYLQLLRPNGRYVLCGGAGGVPGSEVFDLLLRDFHRSPTLLAFSLMSVAPAGRRRSWDRVVELFADGRLSAVLDTTFPLTQAATALRRVESGTSFGKVVLLQG
ncbi:zinc-binding dehydrogenase [Actinacidiphila sp. DG2A-62]|uniref:quinone oxidoreductase family protein n=1 Tax=Actinacidiphila sp. DG2A-62 TaxID=3108821 RepID=UPI002DB5A2B6|nr:zinc-binding dehydrogenase [Actinacidiphila sp. DG2A-62]MEC3992445.1 zinc-binding dehydrogenase [Actinacidiphila sp. DG2A-62]